MTPLTHTQVWNLQCAIAREADKQQDEVLLPRLERFDAGRERERAWCELSTEDFDRGRAAMRRALIDASLAHRLSKAERELEFLMQHTTAESLIKLPDNVVTACFDAHLDIAQLV